MEVKVKEIVKLDDNIELEILDETAENRETRVYTFKAPVKLIEKLDECIYNMKINRSEAIREAIKLWLKIMCGWEQ